MQTIKFNEQETVHSYFLPRLGVTSATHEQLTPHCPHNSACSPLSLTSSISPTSSTAPPRPYSRCHTAPHRPSFATLCRHPRTPPCKTSTTCQKPRACHRHSCAACQACMARAGSRGREVEALTSYKRAASEIRTVIMFLLLYVSSHWESHDPMCSC